MFSETVLVNLSRLRLGYASIDAIFMRSYIYNEIRVIFRFSFFLHVMAFD